MISKLSSSISEKLCYANVIPREDQELYSYGFFLLLSRGTFLAVAVIFGILMGTFWESVSFYILFSVLRGYAGGIHASAEAVCMFFTTALLAACLALGMLLPLLCLGNVNVFVYKFPTIHLKDEEYTFKASFTEGYAIPLEIRGSLSKLCNTRQRH